jgi:acyl-CoA-binding protein
MIACFFLAHDDPETQSDEGDRPGKTAGVINIFGKHKYSAQPG